ncbi:MAG: tRNA cyclic N6-threonylcarbamoyladenosine(37) synthase TcdA [Vibrionaceae bacterium]
MDTAYDNFQPRFDGIARLYGKEALLALQKAHVCVVGIGGVGSWAVEALARSGVGHLTLIDMDDVCVTNINRQIHALTSTIGQSKIAVMAERVRAINPHCQVTLIDDFLTKENIAEHISARFDHVLDAIDSVGPKAALLAFCKRNKIKVITIGGAGGQIDPTQIACLDLTKTVHDPLASKLRSQLRHVYNFSRTRKFGIECVFSTEQLRYPKQDGSVCTSKAGVDGVKKMDCANGFGATTVVTASFAFVAVARIIARLTSRPKE